MKILWTVNNLIPEVAEQLGFYSGHAISWVDAMSKRLVKRSDVLLSIASPGRVESVQKYIINGIIYYVFPSKDCDKVDYWSSILSDFHPDVIHAYGTEGKHNNLLLENHSTVPSIISLQGILNEYQRHYYAGIDFSKMLRFTTLKDIIAPTGFFSGRNYYIKRAKNEVKILQLAKNVEGRSTWDRVSALNINSSLNYYYCPRLIRAPFYERSWNPDTMEKHSILVHQGNYPIKGLHFVFEAIGKLKNKYSDLKLYIAGKDIMHPERMSRKLMPSGYVMYLRYLIKKYNIENNILTTGFLKAEQLADKLTQVNVVVIPSSIENAPNSLAEAELVGVPTIASFVGGNMDMLEHGRDGFLYCYNEPNMLAEYISKIFDDNNLAQRLSVHASLTAKKRHDPEILENTIMNIYKDLITK